jgi:hypothetical protein
MFVIYFLTSKGPTSLNDCKLDFIFEGLSKNKSIETFKLNRTWIDLKLENSKSLRFIESNSTLKSIDFGSVSFKIVDMELINEYLIKNNSLTELNLSMSNFRGPFEFLAKNSLKKFFFKGIWHEISSDKLLMSNFIHNMGSNTSLKELNLSVGYSNTYEVKELEEIIEILSAHENIESFSFHSSYSLTKPPDFRKLLGNPKLKELKMSWSSAESIKLIFDGLNNNNNLTILDISGNRETDYSSVNWDKISFSNNSLRKFIMDCRFLIELKSKQMTSISQRITNF